MKKKCYVAVAMLLALSTIALSACGQKKNEITPPDSPSPAELDVSTSETDATVDTSENTESTEPDAAENTEAADAQALLEKQDQLTAARIRHEYGNVLSQLICTNTLPDMEDMLSPYEWGLEMSENRFAIHDFDNDGREELLISYTTAAMAGMFERMYDYNPETQELKTEYYGWPALTFYDSGVIEEGSSHNQTMGELWPFTLSKYNATTDTYDMIGYADSWSKEFADSYYDYETESNIPFPDDIDKNGDGVIFNIQLGTYDDFTWGYQTYKYDNKEFDDWKSSVIGDGQIYEVEYLPIDYDNFANLTTAYLKLVDEFASEQYPVTGTDVGMMYVNGTSSLVELEELLTSKYGLEIIQPFEDFEEEKIAKSGDTQILSINYLDAGGISLENEQYEDLTVFGIYPGMDYDEAVARLDAHGFTVGYSDPDIGSSYMTGNGIGNRSVWLQYKDGKITSVGASPFCAYAG